MSSFSIISRGIFLALPLFFQPCFASENYTENITPLKGFEIADSNVNQSKILNTSNVKKFINHYKGEKK